MTNQRSAKTRWAEIAGFPDYEVSDSGEVWSRIAGRILKPWDESGYRRVRLAINGEKAKSMLVHVLVLRSHVGLPDVGQECNHLNGDKSDNRLCNLEWCSRSDNAKHAFRLGLQRAKRGENNPAAKLRLEQVIEIRSRIESGEVGWRIAADYGVSQVLVSKIGRRELWASAEDASEASA